MNTSSRTLVFVAVAAVTAAIATGVRYANRPAAVEGFSDVGQEFFPGFRDPLKATELSVSKYDADGKEAVSFSVKRNDKGLWVIPSHHDYPAEAAERLARTAAQMIGIRKVALQSRSEDDWARYGVEAPDAAAAIDASTKEGEQDQSRGTRITLRDSSSNPLVDLIVGKAVQGKEKHFYVRQPEKNPVFIAQLDADLSAKFSDWIEPDLLKLNQADISQVVVDRYSVDEEQGAILQGERLEFDKDTTTSKWSLVGMDSETESLKESELNDLARNLDQLKIVGVRPKPEGLNADLTVSREVAQNPLLRQVLQSDMQRQGFYIARGEGDLVKLVSNEGELIAGTKNGVRYTLYFGEIARGTAKDIETGLNEQKQSAEAPANEGDAQPEAGEEKSNPASDAPEPQFDSEETENGPRRYLLVKVEFDESLLGEKPAEPVEPQKPAILNEESPESPEKQPEEDEKEKVPAETPEKPEGADGEPKETPEKGEPEEKKPDAEKVGEEQPDAENSKGDESSEEKSSAENPGELKGESSPDQESDGDTELPPCDEPASAEPAAQDAATEPQKSEEQTTEEKPTDASAPAAKDSKDATASADNESEPEATSPDEPKKEASVDEKAPADEKPADEKPGDTTSETPAAEQQPPADPKADAQKEYLQAMGEYEAAKAGFDSALKSWEDRAREGNKKAEELSERFGAWYYVISADSFEKFKLSRAAVVEPKEQSTTPDGEKTPEAGNPVPESTTPDSNQ